METLKSYRNPFWKIDDKNCETCSYGNYVGWPLTEVFVLDENKKIFLCENCLDKAKRDTEKISEEELLDDSGLLEDKILENRDNLENPDA